MSVCSFHADFIFFFFKQKTAYEMRISDWSSDVCSSDLMDFVDMMMFTIFGKRPSQNEKTMINHILVTACDHGLTPSAMSARLTYLGAPEAPQAAVAGGLLGAGSVYLGTTQNCAEMLGGAAADLDEDADDDTFLACARRVIQSSREKKQFVYGLGHPIHIDGDPRVPTLRRLSQELGYFSKHWKLMEAVPKENGRAHV